MHLFYSSSKCKLITDLFCSIHKCSKILIWNKILQVKSNWLSSRWWQLLLEETVDSLEIVSSQVSGNHIYSSSKWCKDSSYNSRTSKETIFWINTSINCRHRDCKLIKANNIKICFCIWLEGIQLTNLKIPIDHPKIISRIFKIAVARKMIILINSKIFHPRIFSKIYL